MELVHDLGEHTLSGGMLIVSQSPFSGAESRGAGRRAAPLQGIEIVFRTCLSFLRIEHKYNNDNGYGYQVGNLNA